MQHRVECAQLHHHSYAVASRFCATPLFNARVDKSVGRRSWTVSHLRHEQSAGIGAEDHACIIAWSVRHCVIIRTPLLIVFLQRGIQRVCLTGRFTDVAGRCSQPVVQWALWRTGDHVGKAAELIGASRNTVSALRSQLSRGVASTGATKTAAS
jgi:hypothetical protein